MHGRERRCVLGNSYKHLRVLQGRLQRPIYAGEVFGARLSRRREGLTTRTGRIAAPRTGIVLQKPPAKKFAQNYKDDRKD
jgi:hypothetical protein